MVGHDYVRVVNFTPRSEKRTTLKVVATIVRTPTVIRRQTAPTLRINRTHPRLQLTIPVSPFKLCCHCLIDLYVTRSRFVEQWNYHTHIHIQRFVKPFQANVSTSPLSEDVTEI